jgi:pimeloyl-ACP methyl ester carboxylesterase
MVHFPSIEPAKMKVDLGQGVNIHYFDFNSSSQFTTLLLHGLGVCAESWSFQFTKLIESGFRVIAPDLRGFGGSSYPGVRNDVQVMAVDMSRLLQYLEIDSCHILCISMGGAVGLQIALEYPKLVESLILINTFARLRPRRISSWLFYTIRLFLVQIFGISIQARFVAKKLFPQPSQHLYREIFYAQIIQANPNAYRSTMLSLISFDVTKKLDEIQVPVLVITGEKDTIVPPEIQFELKSRIPNAYHEVIQDAGHAVIIDKPDEFNRIMQKFLSQFG